MSSQYGGQDQSVSNYCKSLLEHVSPLSTLSGQMCIEFAFMNGASRVIVIDGGPAAWRLDFVKSKYPKVETINFTDLPKGESITSVLRKMVHSGPDVALECAAGEYSKGWAHYFELMLGLETDTSEILNEMITSVKSFGRCGVTGVYAGYTNHFNIGPFSFKSHSQC